LLRHHGDLLSHGTIRVLDLATVLPQLSVPTLVRFLVVLAILAGLGLGAMFALATLVQPDVREITIPIPSDRLPAPRR
jgi:hypothetical protein